MESEHRPAALLRHSLEDGSSHFDLLLGVSASIDPEAPCALCWRTRSRIDSLRPDASAALEPRPRHRGLYLELSARRELSDGRGVVEPVAHGRWRPIDGERLEFCWTPHGAAWLVRVEAAGALRADQVDILAMATRMTRLREPAA